MGYHQAGFDVTGIDNRPQPHYPFTFILGDALEYVAAHGHEYDAIHASPPCQAYSEATPMAHRGNHPDLIEPTRELLAASGKPFVIENVENARALLINPVMLCGTMFGLNMWRHRYFEIWPFWVMSPATCNHSELPVLITGTTRRKPEDGGRMEYSAQQCRDASGLHWMTRKEMDEAIPPAYTAWIGGHLMTGDLP
jgi:DNA (cytosine-5)-methyltransferase 1